MRREPVQLSDIPGVRMRGNRSGDLRVPLLALAVSVAPMATVAIAAPGDGLRYPSWEAIPPTVWRPLAQREPLQELLARRHKGVVRFASEHPSPLFVRFNETTGSPRRLIGSRFSLLGGDAPTDTTDWDALFRAFLAKRRPSFSGR